MSKKPGPLTARARSLRKDAMPTEIALWEHLKGRQLNGLKFRQQQFGGPFIVDFYCPNTHLVVELDGDTHAGRARADFKRQLCLEEQAVTGLRFCDSEVMNNMDGVLETILAVCGAQVNK
ncbi:MAG: endonuclease domain-containing protein [bacterium]